MSFSKKILVTCSVVALLLPSIGPASLVLASETDVSVESSVQSSEVYASTTLFDGTLVEVLDSLTMRVTYADGSLDLLEKREDGVYKNGELFISSSTLKGISSGTGFRNANSWVTISSTSGRVDSNSDYKKAIGSFLGSILGLVGGNLPGAIIGAVEGYLPTGTPPGVYHKTTIYFNQSQNRFKIVTSFYKNSDFSGYVTTTTNYVNIPG